MDLSATFDASVDRLVFILDWVEQGLNSLKVYPKQVRKIVLAVEEAVMNTIQHGYAGKGGAIQIAIKVTQKQIITIVIKDRAVAFNPLTQAPEPPLEDSLEDKPVGGLGFHLLRQCVDSVDYQREGSYNVLTLTTHFSQTK